MPEESMTPITPEGSMDSAQPAAMDAAPQMPASDDPNKIVITEQDTAPTVITPGELGVEPAAEGSMPTPMDAAPQMPASYDPNKIVITEEETKPTEIVPDPTNGMPAMDNATVSPAVDPAPWSPGATPMGAEQPVQSSESVASTPEAIKEMSTADAIITLTKAANLSPEDTKKIAEELSK